MRVLQVILALSLLIIIHEAGHFTFAKIFGIRVEKFFLFFDAGGFKLFSTRAPWFRRLFPRSEKWETEYGIGWLPLGGYCKISGMIDESLDTAQMALPPKDYEFRTKPAGKRLLVMAGGVLYNFIFAIAAFIAILAIFGDVYIPNEGKQVYVNKLGEELGFRSGDHIIAFDDYKPEDFSMLQADLARRDVSKAKVLRGADTIDIYMDQSRLGEILNSPGMFDLAVPFVIDSIPPTSPNFSVLERGDKVLSVDSVDVRWLQDARPLLRAHSGDVATLGLLRGGDSLSVDVAVDTLGLIGVYTVPPKIDIRHYTLAQAVPAGCSMAFSTVGGYLRDLKLVFTPRTEAYKSVGSFISIGMVFPKNWNTYSFLNIIALLSIMLGVMNLLPVPGLDGGHIVFCLYEMITRRKPSDRFMTVAQIIGMALLIGLMILAFGNDIGRLIR